MNLAWANALPSRRFEASHLSIDYISNIDEARGFILDETNRGIARKYLYEASYRSAKWNIKLTTANPENTRDFHDRDGASKSIRSISGMKKQDRPDLEKNLQLKLEKFRSNIIREEERYRQIASQGTEILIHGDLQKYYLAGNMLIRISRTAIREFVLALEAPDISQEAILDLIT